MSLMTRIAAAFGVSAAGGCGPESLNVERTELFGGEVSLCYHQPYGALMKDGGTGLPELDMAEEPTLDALNAALRPFARELRPTPSADTTYLSGGSGAWKHICDVDLPDDAVFYAVFGKEGETAEKTYPSVLRSLGPDSSVRVARWIADGRLVHVEIAVGERRRTGNLSD